MIPRGYLLYKCQQGHPKINEKKHTFISTKAMYDTESEGNRLKDLPIKIYRFLLEYRIFKKDDKGC